MTGGYVCFCRYWLGIFFFFYEMIWDKIICNYVFPGVGWAAVTVAIIIVIYYNVIVAWCIYYFFASMSDPLPWVGCDNWWNTEYCYDGSKSYKSNADSAEAYHNKHLNSFSSVINLSPLDVGFWRLMAIPELEE